MNIRERLLHVIKKLKSFVSAGKLEETPLHIAASAPEGGEKCVQMLLKSGSDPNLRRSDGDTPLHVAACTGHVDVVRLLMADEADPLRQNQVIHRFSCSSVSKFYRFVHLLCSRTVKHRCTWRVVLHTWQFA
jgi:ankyrin repeat protein